MWLQPDGGHEQDPRRRRHPVALNIQSMFEGHPLVQQHLVRHQQSQNKNFRASLDNQGICKGVCA